MTTTAPFDAVTLEVIWRRMISAADEAAKTLQRTSFSTLVNESNDFACVHYRCRRPQPRPEHREHSQFQLLPAGHRAAFPKGNRPGEHEPRRCLYLQ